MMASRNARAAGTIEYGQVLDRVVDAVGGVLGRGRVSDQIPALADYDPDAFGLAVATVGGELHGVGDCRRSFSIQSISKVFTLALVIAQGGDALWTPSGASHLARRSIPSYSSSTSTESHAIRSSTPARSSSPTDC